MMNAWVPVAPCDESCVRDDPVGVAGRVVRFTLLDERGRPLGLFHGRWHVAVAQ